MCFVRASVTKAHHNHHSEERGGDKRFDSEGSCIRLNEVIVALHAST